MLLRLELFIFVSHYNNDIWISHLRRARHLARFVGASSKVCSPMNISARDVLGMSASNAALRKSWFSPKPQSKQNNIDAVIYVCLKAIQYLSTLNSILCLSTVCPRKGRNGASSRISTLVKNNAQKIHQNLSNVLSKCRKFGSNWPLH